MRKFTCPTSKVGTARAKLVPRFNADLDKDASYRGYKAISSYAELILRRRVVIQNSSHAISLRIGRAVDVNVCHTAQQKLPLLIWHR
jgi:hypothetical protein